MCNGCPSNYCKYGKCSLVNNGGPQCECDTDYIGQRCEKKKSPVEEPTSSSLSGGLKVFTIC